MKKILIQLILVLGILSPAAVSAQSPDSGVQTVLDKYHSALPMAEDLTVYSLDWASSFDEAKQKAAREERPILLIVVTNSYGNMYTGHC